MGPRVAIYSKGIDSDLAIKAAMKSLFLGGCFTLDRYIPGEGIIPVDSSHYAFVRFFFSKNTIARGGLSPGGISFLANSTKENILNLYKQAPILSTLTFELAEVIKPHFERCPPGTLDEKATTIFIEALSLKIKRLANLSFPSELNINDLSTDVREPIVVSL